MTLTKSQVKERLGRGAVMQIATALQCSKSHVSRVLNERRTDPMIAAYVAKKLRVRLLDLPSRYHTDHQDTATFAA